MSACLAIGAVAIQLAGGDFMLGWTHSIEKVRWEEYWTVGPDHLTLDRSRIKGSGAGMEPGPDAIWDDGWWVSPGHLQVPQLVLAASGATGGGWTLCADGVCRMLAVAASGPITLGPCE